MATHPDKSEALMSSCFCFWKGEGVSAVGVAATGSGKNFIASRDNSGLRLPRVVETGRRELDHRERRGREAAQQQQQRE